MKKFSFTTVIAFVCLLFSSCGLGSLGATDALSKTQTTLNAAGAAEGLVSSLLGTLLSGATTSEQALVGIWVYASPKVVFESENILAKLGGAVASNKVESTLGGYLKKAGFSVGKTSLTLKADKTCILSLNGKEANGTYAYDSARRSLVITGAFGVASMTCTATIENGQLLMLFDADKILTILTNVSSISNSSLGTFLQNYSGMKLGWAMKK